MSDFWNNNKGTFKKVGIATLKGAGKGSVIVGKAGMNAVKKARENQTGTGASSKQKDDGENETTETDTQTSSPVVSTVTPLNRLQDPKSFAPPPKRNANGVQAVQIQQGQQVQQLQQQPQQLTPLQRLQQGQQSQLQQPQPVQLQSQFQQPQLQQFQQPQLQQFQQPQLQQFQQPQLQQEQQFQTQQFQQPQLQQVQAQPQQFQQPQSQQFQQPQLQQEQQFQTQQFQQPQLQQEQQFQSEQVAQQQLQNQQQNQQPAQQTLPPLQQLQLGQSQTSLPTLQTQTPPVRNLLAQFRSGSQTSIQSAPVETFSSQPVLQTAPIEPTSTPDKYFRAAVPLPPGQEVPASTIAASSNPSVYPEQVVQVTPLPVVDVKSFPPPPVHRARGNSVDPKEGLVKPAPALPVRSNTEQSIGSTPLVVHLSMPISKSSLFSSNAANSLAGQNGPLPSASQATETGSFSPSVQPNTNVFAPPPRPYKSHTQTSVLIPGTKLEEAPVGKAFQFTKRRTYTKDESTFAHDTEEVPAIKIKPETPKKKPTVKPKPPIKPKAHVIAPVEVKTPISTPVKPSPRASPRIFTPEPEENHDFRNVLKSRKNTPIKTPSTPLSNVPLNPPSYETASKTPPPVVSRTKPKVAPKPKPKPEVKPKPKPKPTLELQVASEHSPAAKTPPPPPVSRHAYDRKVMPLPPQAPPSRKSVAPVLPPARAIAAWEPLDLDLELETAWFVDIAKPVPLCFDNYTSSMILQNSKGTRIVNARFSDLSRAKVEITFNNSVRASDVAALLKSVHVNRQDYSPPLNPPKLELIAASQKFGTHVADWSENALGTKVGTGECWDLAKFALQKGCGNHAFVSSGYIHGVKLVTLTAANGKPVRSEQFDEIRRGDIIQYKLVVLKSPSREERIGMPDHTAVILESNNDVKDIFSAEFVIAQQNVNNVKIVVKSNQSFKDLYAGEIQIFRPISKEWAGDLENL